MVKWSSANIKLLKELTEAGKSDKFIAAHFQTSSNNVRQIRFQNNIKRPEKTSDTSKAGHKTRKKKQLTQEDLAHRLMVLQGFEVKKVSYTQVFDDKQLLSWIDDVQKFASELLLFNNEPLELQEYQMELIDIWEENRYSIACCGRQVGKSLTVAIYTLWKSITTPNYFTAIISPSDRQSKELFNKIIGFCARNNQLYDSVVNPRSDEVSFTNGSRIVSLPGRGSITGYTGVDTVIIDEAGLPELPDKVYADATPMLLAKHGKLILLGTPKGKATKFYAYWNNPLFAKFHVPTSKNMSLPDLEKFLEDEKRRCSVIEYQQEYDGVFMDMDGTFIPSRYIDQSIQDYDYVLQSMDGKRYYAGIDWGRFSDKSVIIVISEFQNEVKVEYAEAFSKTKLQKVKNKVEYLDRVFKFDKIIPEYNGLSIPIVDEMVSNLRVEAFTSTNERKFEGYALLRKLFEDEKIVIPAQETRLITELRYLEMSLTPSGKTKIAHAPGQHDDFCTALMLACWGFKEPESEPYQMRYWTTFSRIL